jgi:outer membrane protein insertion porin family
MDLVYEIEEGDQYRVGRIIVNIEGDESHTRESVVLNRLSIKSGDIVDIREIRNSTRRLKASQLFLHDPAQGISPEIVVNPTPLGMDASSIADQGGPHSSGGAAYRGQSPEGSATSPSQRATTPRHRVARPLVDLHVNVRPIPEDTGSPP